MSPYGTFETFRWPLGMSAHRGRPEVDGRGSSDAIDPSETLAVHCDNGFNAGFTPYQSTRLSLYDAAS
jgi:hypothetical protein